jgi:hypothetical protein
MRRIGVYAALIAVVAVSVAAGVIASDWPHWCARLAWCGPDFPRR